MPGRGFGRAGAGIGETGEPQEGTKTWVLERCRVSDFRVGGLNTRFAQGTKVFWEGLLAWGFGQVDVGCFVGGCVLAGAVFLRLD